MPCLRIALTLLLGFAATARATPPATIALMGLRPGMSPARVLAVLRGQAARITSRDAACPGHTGRHCLRELGARVPDGRIAVSFTSGPGGAPRAWRIRLTTDGAGGPDHAARFGPPAHPGARVWHAAGPRLRARAAPAGGTILSLSDPALRRPGLSAGAPAPAE